MMMFWREINSLSLSLSLSLPCSNLFLVYILYTHLFRFLLNSLSLFSNPFKFHSNSCRNKWYAYLFNSLCFSISFSLSFFLLSLSLSRILYYFSPPFFYHSFLTLHSPVSSLLSSPPLSVPPLVFYSSLFNFFHRSPYLCYFFRSHSFPSLYHSLPAYLSYFLFLPLFYLSPIPILCLLQMFFKREEVKHLCSLPSS